MLVKKGDAVIDVEPPRTISSEKMCHESGGPSKRSNKDGVTIEDPVQALVQKLHALPGQPHVSRPATIFHVLNSSKSMKTIIEPEMVSIGPYHHGKESLRTIENHKVWYLRDFLTRKPEISMEVYLQEMRAMEMQARQCYDDVIEMSADEFSLMLLLDGCFILEYFLKIEDKEPDYVVDVGWSSIELDFMKLENQIPYSIIHKLASIYYYGTDHNCDDHKCPILSFVYKKLMYEHEFVATSPHFNCGRIDHLLHLYQLCMKPASIPDQTSNSENNQPLTMKARCLSWLWPQSLSVKARSCFSRLASQSLSVKAQSCISWLWSRLGLQHKKAEVLYKIPSATKLSEAGVTFKEKIDPRNKFDITFENGVLEIPFRGINIGKKILFANVLLYEQSRNERDGLSFTSYFLLMDHLIDTSDDVALLVHAGIFGNFLQNDEEVAIFFNELSNYTIIEFYKSHYIDLVKEVVNYINSPWHRYRAILVRNYFSNPWSIISVIAAAILLLLSATQTGFTAYPVVHPK